MADPPRKPRRDDGKNKGKPTRSSSGGPARAAARVAGARVEADRAGPQAAASRPAGREQRRSRVTRSSASGGPAPVRAAVDGDDRAPRSGSDSRVRRQPGHRRSSDQRALRRASFRLAAYRRTAVRTAAYGSTAMPDRPAQALLVPDRRVPAHPGAARADVPTRVDPAARSPRSTSGTAGAGITRGGRQSAAPRTTGGRGRTDGRGGSGGRGRPRHEQAHVAEHRRSQPDAQRHPVSEPALPPARRPEVGAGARTGAAVVAQGAARCRSGARRRRQGPRARARHRRHSAGGCALPKPPRSCASSRVEVRTAPSQELARAAEAVNAGHERDAARILRPLRDAYPDAAAVRELLGLCHYRLGQYPAAAKELGTFADLTGSVEQHPVLMDCARAQKKYAGSRRSGRSWRRRRRRPRSCRRGAS